MIRDHQTYYNGLHIHQPYYFPPSGRCVDLVTCHLPFQLFVECNLERTIDPSAVTPISSEKGNAHKTALQFSCLGIFDSTSRQTSFLAPETDFRGSVSGQSSQTATFLPLSPLLRDQFSIEMMFIGQKSRKGSLLLSRTGCKM